MNYLKNLLKKIMPKDLVKPVGRWKPETCTATIDQKIDFSNFDHCGPCGQYNLTTTIKAVKKEKLMSVKTDDDNLLKEIR
jgi:hypothetical protein